MGCSTQCDALPLYVDLDGSLISTDSLWESIIALLRRDPLAIFQMVLWLFSGKAVFKNELAKRQIPNAKLLPYRQDVLDKIKAKRASGALVILATAADRRIAESVAEHLGLFTSVLASDGATNLSGSNKLAAIQADANGDFEYIGDTWVDMPIWEVAKTAIVVPGSQALVKRLQQSSVPVEEVRTEQKSTFKVLARAMRFHQWVKNVLLLVPMFLAHEIDSISNWTKAIAAFFCFSLLASSVYIVNDILDIESDRSHPKKRTRPFASGEISIRTGVLLVPILFLIGVGVSYQLVSPTFAFLAGLYVFVSFSYSIYFKSQPIIDLLMLASFYAYRVVLGGVAVGVENSPWLLAFSVFFFLSLAMIKRYADLLELDRIGESEAKGRSYTKEDMPIFQSMGQSTSCTSVFVLAMYISSDKVTELYQNTQLLWLICPILMYWIMRIWFITNRGQLHHDPIVFALKDTVSHMVALCIGLVLVFAKGF